MLVSRTGIHLPLICSMPLSKINGYILTNARIRSFDRNCKSIAANIYYLNSLVLIIEFQFRMNLRKLARGICQKSMIHSINCEFNRFMRVKNGERMRMTAT